MKLVAVAGVVVAFGATSVVAAGDAAPNGGAAVDPVLALAALDRKVADLDAQEQADKSDLASLDAPIQAAHARVVARGRAFYKMTRAGLLPVGGGFGALVSYAMHVERARRLLTADMQDERRLRDRASGLGAELERIARDRVALSSERAAIGATRAAMDDERRRRAAFERAFETSTGAGSDYVAVYGGPGGVGPDVGAHAFAAARGRLLFPVAGQADVQPARRQGAEGPGLEIRASAGAAVRAVFPGRVAFADRYGSYGRIVILDHGDHYYTVSGNLDAIDVKIGQAVDAGDRVGTVGDDGQGPMLYFEVRHGSQAVPPGPWLGL